MIKAQYTIVLKTLLDNPEAKAAIEKAMSTYPIYEKKSKEEFMPSYIPTRAQLNEKILNRYKYREIGFETVGRFLDELEISLNEIMPEYNLLFFSADQDFNIIFNVDYQKTMERTLEGSTTANATTTTQTTTTDTTDAESTGQGHAKHVESETPQGKISVPAESIDSVDYADKAAWDKSSSTATSKQTSEGSNESGSEAQSTGTTDDHETTVETTKGNFGVVSSQDLVLKYRESIINIEKMIIEDSRIQELFLQVY